MIILVYILPLLYFADTMTAVASSRRVNCGTNFSMNCSQCVVDFGSKGCSGDCAWDWKISCDNYKILKTSSNPPKAVREQLLDGTIRISQGNLDGATYCVYVEVQVKSKQLSSFAAGPQFKNLSFTQSQYPMLLSSLNV